MSINPKDLERLGINPFDDEAPEKLNEILPPDIDQSFRKYDKNYKLKQEPNKSNDD